jgi:carotenoid cleavage dioxygenase
MGRTIRLPKNLRGPYQPMRFEATVEECVVSEGKVPDELNGGFYRAGPTWKRPIRQDTTSPYTQIFTQDGMVQGLIFREGRVDFRNRWVRTPKFLAEERAGESLFEWSDCAFGDWRDMGRADVVRDARNAGIPQGVHTVNACGFGGQVLALGELVVPYALDPITLDTVGPVPWSTQLGRGLVEPACFGDGAFTAHPKWDPDTGELFGWSAQDVEPFITLHWVQPDGTVKSRQLWDAPYSQWAHDMWLSERYVVLPFMPFVVDTARVAQGRSVNGWDTGKPIVLALIPRDDIDGEIRWITADIEPQYIMHMLGCNHVGNTLQLDAPIFDRPPWMTDDLYAPGDPVVPFLKIANSSIGRWTIDLDTGTVKSERLDDCPMELPKVDERYYGKPYTWGFLEAGERNGDGMRINTVVRRNVHTGAEDRWVASRDPHDGIFEATFAPRSKDAPEGDGYLIVPICRFAANRSEFVILDTRDITAGPVARIDLPFQIGFTPHGHWMDFR